MGRNHIRLGVWALAILTSFAVFGDHTAYAWNSQPRVQAGGWVFQGNTGEKVKFGLTGRCTDGGFTSMPNQGLSTSEKCNQAKGEFEYKNQGSGLKAHGHVTSLTFEPVFAGDGCATDAAGGNSALTGRKAAHLTGMCPDGSCSFDIKVVDGDDAPPPPGQPSPGDWVCNVTVQDNKHAPDNYFGAPLVKGDVEVRNYGN